MNFRAKLIKSLNWSAKRKELRVKTCPKGFGLKLAKLRLKTPFKNIVKHGAKLRKAEQEVWVQERFGRSSGEVWEKFGEKFVKEWTS